MAPPGEEPFRLDAEVFEEDTYLVLSTTTELQEPAEHPLKIWNAVHEAEPRAPGTVHVTGGSPLRFLAVVHDLQLSPTWTEDWVSRALDQVFLEAESRKLHGLSLPPLGTLHGTLRPRRFTGLLRQALDRADLYHLERLWILAPASDIPFVDA
jgi:hypothetical protein